MSDLRVQRAKLTVLPATGLWRVSSWHAPFDPPPPPPALGTAGADEDNAGRWDAPDESFRVLYCATDPEGAIGEKIAPFAQNPSAVARIEAFFDDEPDAAFADDFLAVGLTADDVTGMDATLAVAGPQPGAVAIDVAHPRTLRSFAAEILKAVAPFGMNAIDRLTALTHERGVTRTVAGIYHRAACDGGPEPRSASGLRFTSRLAPAWECSALWEPVPVELPPVTEPLTIDNPHLRSAAAQLGVVLYDAVL